MQEQINLTTEIKKFCLDQGAKLVAIADIGPLREGLMTFPADLLTPYTAAISIAITLDMKAAAAIRGEPTPQYAANCKDINARLNKIRSSIADRIRGKGFKTEAIDLSKCHNHTLKYMDVAGVGYTFCGQCIPVCPHGSKYMRKLSRLSG